MARFGMEAFCVECCRHKHTPPFGSDDWFWDSTAGPCPHCGSTRFSAFFIARWQRRSRWPWRTAGDWIRPDGTIIGPHPAGGDTCLSPASAGHTGDESIGVSDGE